MPYSLSQEEIQAALCQRHSLQIQEKLNQAHVAIAGLGGLGSNIAVSLARIGVGHLQLADFDKVDITNLNRQQYFIHHLGMYKTDALKEELLQINPYLDIRTHCVKITEQNIPEIFADAPIICEAFDVPENKAILVNTIREVFPDKKIVAASGMAGFGDSNAIRTKQVMKNLWLCGDETTEPAYAHGLMAPRVAICAGHQANLIVQLILENIKRTYISKNIKEDL